MRRTTICREGWYYLLVLAMVFGGALVREINLLLVLAGMLAGPLLLSRFMAVFALHGLVVRRKAPQNVCAGDLLVGSLVLSNTRRRVGSWAVVAEEEIRPDNDDDPRGRAPARAPYAVWSGRPPLAAPSVLFPYLPARQSRKGSYRGRIARRGRYRLGPLRLSTRFPFGLFRHAVTVGRSERLLVFPRLGRLTRGWLGRRHESFAGTNRRERRAGSDGDFYGIRPWQSGDGRRAIHWRTSARTGKLVVRQLEQPRNRDLLLLVDLWRPPQPRDEDLESVELAVSFAATVAADLCRRGDSSLYLAAVEDRVVCSGGPASAALLQELMQRLAVIEAGSDDRLAELLSAALGRWEPGMEIVLVTTRPVDLGAGASLGSVGSDPVRGSALRHARVIDASSPALERYFQAE